MTNSTNSTAAALLLNATELSAMVRELEDWSRYLPDEERKDVFRKQARRIQEFARLIGADSQRLSADVNNPVAVSALAEWLNAEHE